MQDQGEHFSENISGLWSCGDVIDENTIILNAISNEMVTNIDMLSALMVGRIYSDCESALVVWEYGWNVREDV